jgi:hypothetical protein
MLADLTEGLERSYGLWKDFIVAGHSFALHPLDEMLEIFDDLHRCLQTPHIERLLAAESVKCRSCVSKWKAPSSTGGMESNEEGEESPEGDEVDEERSEPPSPNASGLPEIYSVRRVPKYLLERHKEMKGACCRPSRKPVAIRKLITLEPKAFEILRRSRF